MGFTVDTAALLVTVDRAHNHFCITAPEGNPVVMLLPDSLSVTSIFARTKGKRARGCPGDNNPMLYALKGMHNLNTRARDIGELCHSFRKIFAVFLNNQPVWDWIVPLPSGSQVCARFARKVHQRVGQGHYVDWVLIKRTAGEVLSCIGEMRISARDKNTLSEEIKRFIKAHGPQAPFQIKTIKRVNLRRYINPLALGQIRKHEIPPARILLIDDMVTTGTSLRRAAELLRHQYPDAHIEALTLFGSSKSSTS
ncbi:phosphoribosyltransferase [Pluralibacter gergoviae]|nr:phosphoribosyltransferase [Pluralibacter gergoviae]ELW9441549.1 phosphoribosyltransferase [Pluralibacter gergoviae]